MSCIYIISFNHINIFSVEYIEWKIQTQPIQIQSHIRKFQKLKNGFVMLLINTKKIKKRKTLICTNNDYSTIEIITVTTRKNYKMRLNL